MAGGGDDAAEFDVAVVGGGPAGLSAALWLGRYGRTVRVLDTSSPRNAPTWAVHGFPGLPDPTPHELRRKLLEQAQSAGTERTEADVVDVNGRKDRFSVRSRAGEEWRTRRVLLAFGRRDRLPDFPGAEELYGTSLFHCPDCDGPSAVGARVGVIGGDDTAAALALFLSHWAASVTILSHGAEPSLGPEAQRRLRRYEVSVRSEPLVDTHSTQGRLREVALADGSRLPLDCLFFHSRTLPACDLARPIGCACDPQGHVEVDHAQETTVPGVYAAGDLTGHPYLAIAAAAEGVRAALAIHRSLLPDDFRI